MRLAGTYAEKVTWATELIDSGRHDDARKLLRDIFNDYPDDWWVLHLQAFLEKEQENYAISLALYEKCIPLMEKAGFEPAEIWNNLGECCHFLWQHERGLRYLSKAATLDPKNPDIWNNIAVCYLYTNRPKECEDSCVVGLQIDNKHIGCIDNLGVSQLMRRKWKDGWHNYEVSLGQMYRVKYDYDIRLPDGTITKPKWWNGEKDEVLVVGAEQGLGDEIMFSSAIPDLQKMSKHVILECNQKLEGLLQRSFPEVEVHGTRYEKEPVWRTAPTASTSIASALRFTRNSDNDFPGTKYLEADPLRRSQWQGLFSHMGSRPKIGIAWSGGVRSSGHNDRTISLDRWEEILQLDADFINLEYQPANLDLARTAHTVHTFPWATLTQDYDDTAALVAELDLVISVPTSIVHLAGGLGVECWCMVNKNPNWRFGPHPKDEGIERFIWSDSVRLFRQEKEEEWEEVISRVAEELKTQFFLEKKAA